MATIKPNSYVLNVDIKQRMSNKTPRFVQFDEAQIVFKIYDGGKPFDLSGFTSAIVTHKTRSNQVISGYGTFENLNGQRVVVYDYMGSEMKELGNVETSLSIYNDENDKVSVMPFNVQIVRDLSHEYSEKDTSVLQDLIAKTTDAISKIEYAEDQGDYAKEQGTFAETQGNHAKTQGDYAQTQGTRAETLGNKAETQVDQAQDILDVAVPAYERVEEVYSNTVNLENQHAYDATKQYYKNNIVEFNGSSYQALQDTKGNQPPVNASNEYWSLLARKGADGTGTVVRHREEFISTEGQTTFTLKNTYDQFQNRIDVTVGNVPQFSPDNFTEATNTSIKLNEPLPAGIQVVVTYFSEAQPLKSDIQTVVNNHTTNLNENNATISSLSTQLADKSNVNNERVQIYNGREATDNPLEAYNFAGQGTGNDQSALSIHNYTDGSAANFDNVGKGDIITVGNSRNPTHRIDKPDDYSGTGNVLRYRRYNHDIRDYQNIFTIDQYGNFNKTSALPEPTGTWKFTSNRPTMSGYGMEFNMLNKQGYPFVFMNGGRFMYFREEGTSSPKAVIVSDTPMTGGLEMRASKGDLLLRANEGKVRLYDDGSYHPVQLARTCTTDTRPTDFLQGMSILDLTLNKPIWCRAAAVKDSAGNVTTPAIWIDAMGNTV